MERVAIIGPAGAGKSELARALAARTGLPVFYLDHVFWTREWTPAPRRQAVDALASAVARERWIIDGNFLFEEGDGRFDRADTVVFLDLPRRTCVRRVLWRAIRDRRTARPDLPHGCSEGFDAKLLRWIWSYGRKDRPRVLGLLASLRDRTAVHRLRSRAEVARFLEATPPET